MAASVATLTEQITFEVDRSLPETVTRVITFVKDGEGRIVEQDSTRIVATFGSRRAYRILGLFLGGRKRLPVRLEVRLISVTPGSKTAVSAKALSDEGDIRWRISLAEQAFQEKLPTLLENLGREVRR